MATAEIINIKSGMLVFGFIVVGVGLFGSVVSSGGMVSIGGGEGTVS